ncbi:MAG: TlpA family protein disulfide reductase [Chloroflexi bacterium]|nr:MAG: TlpA family protein disulfide reductase [Chloroflexota bacterium]
MAEEAVQPKTGLHVGRLLVWVVIFALLGLLGWGLIHQSQSRPESGLAPDFTMPIFSGYENEFTGGKVTLSQLRGRIVVVNFWASWCVECRREAKELETVWRTYRDQGVVVLGVDYVDTESKARTYLEEFNITYPNGPDLRSRISDTYHITGVPETFVVDRDGRIVLTKVGPFRPGELDQAIRNLLSQ